MPKTPTHSTYHTRWLAQHRNPFIRYLKASRSRSERRHVRQILRVPLGVGVEMIQ